MKYEPERNNHVRLKLSRILDYIPIDQKSISIKLGIHPSLFSKFKIGERDLNLEELDLLEDFLNKLIHVFDIKEV